MKIHILSINYKTPTNPKQEIYLKNNKFKTLIKFGGCQKLYYSVNVIRMWVQDILFYYGVVVIKLMSTSYELM